MDSNTITFLDVNGLSSQEGFWNFLKTSAKDLKAEVHSIDLQYPHNSYAEHSKALLTLFKFGLLDRKKQPFSLPLFDKLAEIYKATRTDAMIAVCTKYQVNPTWDSIPQKQQELVTQLLGTVEVEPGVAPRQAIHDHNPETPPEAASPTTPRPASPVTPRPASAMSLVSAASASQHSSSRMSVTYDHQMDMGPPSIRPIEQPNIPFGMHLHHQRPHSNGSQPHGGPPSADRHESNHLRDRLQSLSLPAHDPWRESSVARAALHVKQEPQPDAMVQGMTGDIRPAPLNVDPLRPRQVIDLVSAPSNINPRRPRRMAELGSAPQEHATSDARSKLDQARDLNLWVYQLANAHVNKRWEGEADNQWRLQEIAQTQQTFIQARVEVTTTLEEFYEQSEEIDSSRSTVKKLLDNMTSTFRELSMEQQHQEKLTVNLKALQQKFQDARVEEDTIQTRLTQKLKELLEPMQQDRE